MSIGLIYLVLNTFIIDLPWNQLDFNIKPSGSDILTYENQARLIFEGDGLRGGADVFWYSPGYRYLLYFVHIIFGDGWGIAWKIILAVTIFLIYKISNSYEILPILLVSFLVFDNVRNLYLFGVSETLSLLFVLLSIVNKKHTIISSIFLAVATLIRPEIILFSILFLIINKSTLGLISFGIPMLFPLLHNIFYGGEFVIMSTAATYSRNITFDIQNNLQYLIFNPFSQKIPLPNWRISFDGLGKIKPLRKHVKKLAFSHGYRSNFSLSSYTTNLNGSWDDEGNPIETDIAGNFISERQIMTLNILEQFSPLIGMDITLVNNLSLKLEIKKDRNVSLSLANNQITEIKGSEMKIGTGYTWRKLQLPIKIAGKSLEPSNLRMRLDVSVRDNKTITRKIIENQNQATAGQRAVTIQFSGDYNLTKQLMLRLYFDRRINTPFVSTSFPTANTNAGFALRFQLR